MLGKLIKYDLKKTSKTVIVYIIITFIFCVITRIMSNYNNSIMGNIFYSILRGVSISCIVGVIINFAMSIWVRFRHNIYADESYLTHTLPVSKNTLYNSKIISAYIIIIITIILLIGCTAIAFLNNDTIEIIKSLFQEKSNRLITIGWIITAILEIIYAIHCGIVGILIGNQSNNKKIVRSIVIGILLYYIIQTILLIAIYGFGLLNSNIKELFATNPDITNLPAGFKSLILISNCLYVIAIIGMYLWSKKILNKGVNIE